jgi:hypothetical protein
MLLLIWQFIQRLTIPIIAAPIHHLAAVIQVVLILPQVLVVVQIRAAAIHSIKGGYSMRYLHEIALYFNILSDKADEIRKLDRDHYKHHSDMEILEEVLNDKIESLKNQE